MPSPASLAYEQRRNDMLAPRAAAAPPREPPPAPPPAGGRAILGGVLASLSTLVALSLPFLRTSRGER
jgi:hypothetical protein